MDDEKYEGQGDAEEEEEAREAQLARLCPLLLNACMKNETDSITSLLEEMADPLCEDHRQWSPLMWAACHGNEVLLRILIKKGAAEPYKYLDGKKIKKHSPLHWASYRGHLRCLWLLLAQQLSPLEKDVIGNTVLHQGAAGGNLEVVKCLLAQGTDVFAKNDRGHTPYDLCTVLPVQQLLKKAMNVRACQLTGKQFSGTVYRYLCSWSHAIVCRDAIVKIWVYPDEDSDEKEKPFSLSRDAKEIVLDVENTISTANSNGQLEEIKEALEKALNKPVCCKLKLKAEKTKAKLESFIRLNEAMTVKDIIGRDVEQIVEAEPLAVAAENLGRALQDAQKKGVDPGLVDKGQKLRRRLLCECTLTRALRAPPKLTVGYIKYVQELIDSCEAELGNKHLIVLCTALRKRISAEREMSLKYEEVYELCQLKSIAEASADDPRYPNWIDDMEVFGRFQEQYVLDVEYGRETSSTPEMIENCEKQLAILEDLLVEKRVIVEESSIKKKKGKGKKK